MIFLWAMVVLCGVIMFVLGPVLLVTKHMVWTGVALAGVGILVLVKGLAGASRQVESKK